MPPSLSFVIPAWNEARRLPPALRAVADFGRAWPGGLEIVIVVEGSTDGTLEIARDFAGSQADSSTLWVVIDGGPQRGKGHAVRTGMRQAAGELVFYMDADLSVPLAEVPAFVAAFEGAAAPDVLLGNRQHARSRITRAQSWLRRSMGQTFNTILTALGLASCHDTQCGFKAFRQAAARRIFAEQRLDGFAFDVEVLLLAHRQGWKIQDFPVEWINSPESKVRIVRDSLRMLRDALRVRRRLRELPTNQTNRNE